MLGVAAAWGGSCLGTSTGAYLLVSRKETHFVDISIVNLIVGLICFRKMLSAS